LLSFLGHVKAFAIIIYGQTMDTEDKKYELGYLLDGNLEEALKEFEKNHIERTLEKTAGDKKRAAELLGFSLSTLYRKMEKLGLRFDE